MNVNDFTIEKSTVVSVVGTNEGNEIWVRHENGIESAYVVNDPNFRAREGHQITAIYCGKNVVAVRNDNTYKKIQLLSGENLLGPGPDVQPKSGTFWAGWAFFICCPGLIVAGIPGAIFNIGDNIILKYIGGILSLATYLAFVFGIPYWFIIRPRLLRRKHQQRVKAADTAIASLFNSL